MLAHFARATFYDGSPFQPSAMEEALDAARAVDRAGLPIREAFAFAVAPIDRRDAVSTALLDRWAQARAGRHFRARVAGEDRRRTRRARAHGQARRRLSLAGPALPDTFDEAEATKALRSRANAAIEARLQDTASRRIAAGADH